jgi:hypothetical protein
MPYTVPPVSINAVSVTRLARFAVVVSAGCLAWNPVSPNVRAMGTSNREMRAAPAVAPATMPRSRPVMSTAERWSGACAAAGGDSTAAAVIMKASARRGLIAARAR